MHTVVSTILKFELHFFFIFFNFVFDFCICRRWGRRKLCCRRLRLTWLPSNMIKVKSKVISMFTLLFFIVCTSLSLNPLLKPIWSSILMPSSFLSPIFWFVMDWNGMYVAPHLTGLTLKFLVWLLEFPLIGSFIINHLKKQNKMDEVRLFRLFRL